MQRLWRWIRTYFVFLGILVTLLFFAGFWQVSKILQKESPTPTLRKDAQVFLQLKLDGALLESSPEGKLWETFWAQFLGKPLGSYLLEIKTGLDQAAIDPRVKGLFLNIQELSGSMSAFTELRKILLDFKEKGKPIYAWLYQGDYKSYYLASLADKIYLSPIGELTLSGPSVELVYFGAGLQKLGVEVEIVRAGKFKSAFEPFVANEPSIESQEMYEALIASLHAHMAPLIASGRQGASLEKVEEWFRRSLFSPQAALAAGLVDGLDYVEEAKKQAFADGYASYDFYDFAATLESSSPIKSNFSDEAGIALIEAVGEIHLEAKGDGEVITPANMQKQLDWAAKSDKVKAVVLYISSPGGSATAADIIWNDVKTLAAKKPVVVSMGDVAASGGYYIAAPAQKILAQPTSITGSIGVIGMVPKFKDFQGKYGVSFHTITKSERKDMLNPSRSLSEEDKALLAEGVDRVYQVFIEKVAAGRHLSLEAVEKVGQGRVWTGLQALELGLVDELGGLYDALQAAKSLAKLDIDKKYQLLRWQPKTPSLSDCLHNYRNCFPASIAQPSLHSYLVESGAMLQPLETLRTWHAYLRKEPIQAWWPGQVIF